MSEPAKKKRMHENYVIEKEYTSFNFRWDIRRRWRISDREKLASDMFSSKQKDIDDRWCLELYGDRNGWLWATIKLISLKDYSTIGLIYRLFFLDPLNERKMINSNFIAKMSEGQMIEKSRVMHIRSPISDRIEGALTIICEIDIALISQLGEPTTIQIPNGHLISDLNKTIENQEFGDVVFKIGEKKIRAYKGILSVRSPIFAKMFSQSSKKNDDINEVTISHIKENVFKELLGFIYTDKSPNLDNMSLELLAAAENYKLDRLKAMCEKSLARTIDIKNAAQLFAMADLHNASQLKKKVIAIVKKNAQHFLQSEGFQTLEVSNSDVALKFCKLLLANDP